jgi:dolichol-phosphate mannosyltransferase
VVEMRQELGARTKNPVVLVITPAYREWPNLVILKPEVEHALRDFAEGSRWLVISEPSPPAQQRELLEGSAGRVRIIPRQEGADSFADAMGIGISQIDHADDVVVVMDGDNSHDPAMISKLVLALMEDRSLDVVIASRYVDGGSTENPLALRVMSRVLNIVFRWTFRIEANDLSTNFKAYRASLLRGYRLTSTNFEAVEELLLAAQIRNGGELRILEIPDRFRARLHGESKRKLGQFIGSYLVSLITLRRRVRSSLKSELTADGDGQS